MLIITNYHYTITLLYVVAGWYLFSAFTTAGTMNTATSVTNATSATPLCVPAVNGGDNVYFGIEDGGREPLGSGGRK